MDRYLVEGSFVLTMAGPGLGIIENGALVVSGQEIIATGDSSHLQAEYPDLPRLGGADKLIMPGLIDAHIHTGITLLRGVAQDTRNWMQQGIAPFKRHLQGGDIALGSMVNIIEGIKSGTTTFGDYDYPLDDIIKNYLKVGARACLASTINELSPVMDRLQIGELYPLEENLGRERLEQALELIEKWEKEGAGRLSFLLGPQGPDMLGEKLLGEIKDLSRRFGYKIHMHVAQGDREIDQMEKRYGERSIPFLEKIDYIDQDLIAVHLTEANAEEVALLAAKGAQMIHCPGSIGLIDGLVPPVLEFLEEGGQAALGSDQAPGNNCNNMFNEMKMAAVLNKVKRGDPTVMPAWKALRMATIEGAQVLGLEDRVGSLEKGKKADLLIVDLNQPTLIPALSDPIRNIAPNLVYSARGNEVETVIVNGEIIMEKREMKSVDEEMICREAGKAGLALARRAEKDIKASANETVRLMEKGYL